MGFLLALAPQATTNGKTARAMDDEGSGVKTNGRQSLKDMTAPSAALPITKHG
jgi:hypothetical protein